MKKIACGSWHTMVIDHEDKVWSWGRNQNGMLGNNSEKNSTIPIQIDITNIKDIGAGCFQSMAIDYEDNILVWGENWNGQLGIGNYKRQLLPTKSILNNLNEFKLTEQHHKNFHEEAIHAMGLEEIEEPSIEQIEEPNIEQIEEVQQEHESQSVFHLSLIHI